MYTILELQTDNDGKTVHIVTTEENRAKADSQFYSIMAAACLSNLRYHTAMVIDPEGRALMRDCYKHLPPEPEPEEVSQ